LLKENEHIMATTTNITVQTTLHAAVEKVWKLWTNPVDITNWSTPSPDWHTPKASHNLKPGGEFLYRMEARDGSLGFDFSGTFDVVKPNTQLAYTIADGRKVNIQFEQQGNKTILTETFEAEEENSIEMQRAGWQAILDSFKRYVEKYILIEFTIQIQTSKQKVWETMFHPDTYLEWSNAGWKGSTFKGTWAEGERMKFISPSGEGTLVTLVSHKPYEYSHAKHIAVLLKGDVEDFESELAKGWIGIHERYTFAEEKGVTTLKINITTTAEWEGMFNDGWPKALKKLKEICER
jgi:uncharacterized protein YndB with AHSA1/START domain